MSARPKRPETTEARAAVITHRVALLRAVVDEYVASGRIRDFESDALIAELDAISAELDQISLEAKGVRS